MSSLPVIDDVVGTIVGVTPIGQGPIVVPRGDLGPTNSPLSVPPAVIVYGTPQASSLIVTVAIPLVIGAVSEYICKYMSLHAMYVHT